MLADLIAEGNLCHPSTFYFYTQDDEHCAEFVRMVERFPNTEAVVERHRDCFSIRVRRVDRARPPGAVTWAKQVGMWGCNALREATSTGSIRARKWRSCARTREALGRRRSRLGPWRAGLLRYGLATTCRRCSARVAATRHRRSLLRARPSISRSKSPQLRRDGYRRRESRVCSMPWWQEVSRQGEASVARSFLLSRMTHVCRRT